VHILKQPSGWSHNADNVKTVTHWRKKFVLDEGETLKDIYSVRSWFFVREDQTSIRIDNDAVICELLLDFREGESTFKHLWRVDTLYREMADPNQSAPWMLSFVNFCMWEIDSPHLFAEWHRSHMGMFAHTFPNGKTIRDGWSSRSDVFNKFVEAALMPKVEEVYFGTPEFQATHYMPTYLINVLPVKEEEES
jgi:hypothetical protein